MLVGLYDIDLWSATPKPFVNFELMKVYNYLYQNNYSVRMMTPDDDEEKYNYIIYFKDIPSTKIPKRISLIGQKKHIYGYGFYKRITPLEPKYLKAPPSYLPYDSWTERLKTPIPYDSLKRSSLIRLETNDFSDYEESKHNMVIMDWDFLYCAGAKEFLEKYKSKHNFYFANPLIARDEETFLKFRQYGTIIRNKQLIIDFKYNEDFFFKYYKDQGIQFGIEKRPDETEENHLARLIKIIIFYKKESLVFRYMPYKKTPLQAYISKWALDRYGLSSFADYYKTDRKALKLMDGAPAQIRILLKQSPQTIESSHLDFQKNL